MPELLLDIAPEDATRLLEGALLLVLALLRTLLLLFMFSPRCFLALEVDFLTLETVFLGAFGFLETDLFADLLPADFFTLFFPDFFVVVFPIELTKPIRFANKTQGRCIWVFFLRIRSFIK
jgi:hypothetical protein